MSPLGRHLHDHFRVKCLFEIHETNDKGEHRMRCVRHNCGRVTKTWTTHGPEAHDFPGCKGWPLANEWREWWELFKAAAFITDAERICRFIRWRFNGSPIDQLPPGVPAPSLQPKNFGLSDSEVAELLPGEDPTLIGNRIAALTAALGIPPCGGCDRRREWMNKAHLWLRGG